MLVDWFTLVAQVVNFLILAWLLKRFIYKPILAAIDAREKDIAARIADAEAKKVEAAKDRDDFQSKNAALDRDRSALMAAATEAAAAERQRLLDQARAEFETLRAKQQTTLEREQEATSRRIVARTEQEVFAIARKALTDLAAVSLEGRMVDVFLDRLRALDADTRRSVADATHSSAASSAIVVRSAFPLDPGQQQTIQKAVAETLGAGGPVQFETAPDVVSGIVLVANGHRLAWSIADYLDSLQQNVGDLLKDATTKPPDPVVRAIKPIVAPEMPAVRAKPRPKVVVDAA